MPLLPSDPLALFYGELALAAGVLALASGRAILILSAAIMLASWWYSNAVVEIGGLAGYVRVIPEVDAALGLILWQALKLRPNDAAAVVFALFVAEATIHVTFLGLGGRATNIYIHAINAVYAAQCLTIGGSGAVLMARRITRSDGWADFARWRGAGFG